MERTAVTDIRARPAKLEEVVKRSPDRLILHGYFNDVAALKACKARCMEASVGWQKMCTHSVGTTEHVDDLAAIMICINPERRCLLCEHTT